jgi:Plasmid pRiA4b ORF-3-like protein
VNEIDRQLIGLQIYELKIELLEIEPTIWRQVLVRGSITLAQLHDVIQAAMGWTNSHLHQFIVGAHSYSDPEFEIEKAKSEYRYRLARLAPRVRNTIAYEYDFGDGWEHQIRVERIIEDDKRYPGRPVCLEGKRHGPPEDCGGSGGYQTFLEAIGNKKHPQHKELLTWIGGSFDPEFFDIGDANKRLREIDLRPRW